ncbi:MAG TPA: hypothetical protein VL221_13730 [Bacteroidota bacterium]|nr:hypothetical protein [Bacteroidota bacterium]
MIAGALEIMRGVRGTIVHPLLLPGAQGPDLLGYIVIAYEDRCGLFDILFVRGSRIEHYACLHRELRALLTEGAVRVALDSCRLKCRVSLYALTRQVYNSFLSTFQCAPSLDVTVDGLSRKQVVALAAGMRCANGILEVVRPAFPFPSITLYRFHSPEELLDQAEHIREGRMLAYDVELNAVIGERARCDAGREPGDQCATLCDGGITMGGDEGSPEAPVPVATSPVAPAPAAGPAAATPPTAPDVAAATPVATPLVAPAPAATPPVAPDLATATPVATPPVAPAPAAAVPAENASGSAGRPSPPPLIPVNAGLLISAFKNAMNEFERVGREIYGAHVKRNLPQIVDVAIPGKGPAAERITSVEAALGVLTVISLCVERASPFGKRSLRRVAQQIVKDLHHNHQALLERNGVEKKVRECYWALAGESPDGTAVS